MKKEKRYQLINKDETHIFCISQRKDDCIFHNLRLQNPDDFIVKEVEMDCMSEGEKQLFFKDLIQRIDARPKLHRDINRSIENVEIQELMGAQLGCSINTIYTDYEEIDINYANYIFDVRLYLRPLSSMTEEEKKIYQGYQDAFANSSNTYFFDNFMSIDYLNSKHFDYRHLIEKGLAIEATPDMYLK